MRNFLCISVAILFTLLGFNQSLALSNSRLSKGYINFYYDGKNDKVKLVLDKLDVEMLYHVSVASGLGLNEITELDRGGIADWDAQLVKFVKHGNKVFLIRVNTGYQSTGNKYERNAVSESFPQNIIWTFTIDSVSSATVIVDATDFFKRDALNISSILSSYSGASFNLDPQRSAIYEKNTLAFPSNCEFESIITFVSGGKNEETNLAAVINNMNSVTLRIHHSFIKAPDNNYQPRILDPRIGYFATEFFDFGKPINQPINQYFIHRFRLQKKNPEATASLPEKPIIYYVDPAIPDSIRKAISKGALAWQKAFEAAGFINAFQVISLPDTINPMDIRYNVIRWVDRSTRGYSFGNTIVDPRTGEIIKASVNIEAFRARQDLLMFEGLLAPYKGTENSSKIYNVIYKRLVQLGSHEVGHTLGLRHNFAASSNDRASVMDYPFPRLKLDTNGELDLDDSYANGLGAWDSLAIIWGYSQFSDSATEKRNLDSLAREMQNRNLRFLTDNDVALELSPYAVQCDNGDNPVSEFYNVLKIRRRALDAFGSTNIQEGYPWAYLEEVLVPVYFYHRYQLNSVINMIGGLDYHYAVRGDKMAATRHIPKNEEIKAINAIMASLSPAMLVLPSYFDTLIPPRPQFYTGYRDKELFKNNTGGAFSVLMPAQNVADLTFSSLLTAPRLNRMIEYEIKGGLGITAMLDTIVSATWANKAIFNLNEKLVHFQTCQALITSLISVSRDKALGFNTQARINSYIISLTSYLETKITTSNDAQELDNLRLAVKRLKSPDSVIPFKKSNMPPGLPIGTCN